VEEAARNGVQLPFLAGYGATLTGEKDDLI